MSQRFPGGFITKTPTAPTSSSAPGIWTLDQAMQNQKAGNWPSGFAPYIEDVFSTYLYTGDNATRTITNGIDLLGKGGLVWTKQRASTNESHILVDTARGSGKNLSSNNTDAEVVTGSLTAFTSSGYTISNQTVVNGISAYTYVSWTFRKQAKFFDIVTYTGDGIAGRTVAHNLGSVPGCIIVKRYEAGAPATSWLVYHSSTGNTSILQLNTTDATISSSIYWNNTSPTSSVFSVGTSASVNASGGTYVAYLFAHNASGFGLTGSDNVISCGSWVGDGNSQTITLGYEPQFILWKNASSPGDWFIGDTMRGMTARTGSSTGAVNYLSPNTSSSESSPQFLLGPTSTGFATAGETGTHIYIAIRRGPMKVPTTGTTVFASTGHNGTGATNNSVTFNPVPYIDLTWIKSRNTASTLWAWTDRLRGATKELDSSATSAETTYANDVTGFDFMSASGQSIRLGSGASGNVNTSSYTYSDIGFRRAPGFFDEVCYTGTGSATTFAHNLGVAPELMIVKCRSDASTEWDVYAAPLGATKYLYLQSTNAQATGTNRWNDTAPTSSVFTVATDSSVNGSGRTYVNYLFATCPGVSKVGSYSGSTGNTVVVPCGFTSGVRFVLIKRTDSTGDWYVWDSARGIIAGNDPYLLINSTAAEVTSTDYIDTYSAGFEVTSTAPTGLNATGGTYIFLAIA